MASEFVYSTYKSYKAGTEKVLNWLYENAVKCGYEAEEAETLHKNKKNQKQKPKAKKGQGSKAKGSGKSKSAKTVATQPMAVTVQEFIVLAEVIANSDRKIKVPVWVIYMIKEVISGRRKAARWFSQQTSDTASPDLQESNSGHQHFIMVLEHVLRILSRCPQSRKPAASKGSHDDPPPHVTNIFEILEMDEDTEHTLTNPIPQTDKPGKPIPKVFYKVEKSEGEASWLIYCFFKDFNDAREHLKTLWADYKNGCTDLVTIALLTNTAFEIFQREEIEMLAELRSIRPGFEGRDVQNIILCGTVGHDIKTKSQPDDSCDLHLSVLMAWLCFGVRVAINSILSQVRGTREEPCLTLPSFAKQKYNRDLVALYELLIEFNFLRSWINARPGESLESKIPGEDMLTKGILEMYDTGEAPLWLILALQIQLDIHQLFLKETGRAFEEVSTAAARAAGVVKEYLEFSKDMSSKFWLNSPNSALRNIISIYEFYIKDDMLEKGRTAIHDKNIEFDPFPDRERRHVLWKRHPILCGMFLFHIQLSMQKLGLIVCNAWRFVGSTLHLYNAALAEKAIQEPWIDLEALILYNSEDRIFVGARPNKPEEYAKRHWLVIGASASNFAPTRRSTSLKLVKSKRGKRELLKLPALIQIYVDRYIVQNGQVNTSEFTLNAIEKFLVKSAKIPDVDQAIGIDRPISIDRLIGIDRIIGIDRVIGVDQATDADAERRSRFEKWKEGQSPKPNENSTRRLTTVQFLVALEKSMTAKAFDLNVDYLSLHTKCYWLLRNVEKRMTSMLCDDFGSPMPVVEDNVLSKMLINILGEVGNIPKAARVLEKAGGESYKSEALMEAGKLIAKLIEEEGSKEIERVKGICPQYGGIEPTL